MSVMTMLAKLEEMKKDPEQAKLLEPSRTKWDGKFTMEKFKKSVEIAKGAKR